MNGRDDLMRLGWTDRLQTELQERFDGEIAAGRVIRSAKSACLVSTGSEEGYARLTGSLEYQLSAGDGMPVVGDWVAVARVADPSAPFRIHGVLSRTSAITRKHPDREAVEQVLAANVDLGCIVFSLEGGRKSNPRAAERYATTVWASGAQPLVLLNKADLAEDVEQSVAEIEAVVPGVTVLPLSCVTGSGIEEVRRHLAAGTTTVLLGPSGAGKSSLINLLAGSERQAVGEIRGGDMKGRHTTTHRELLVLPDGALIIDTPGLRELQLWAEVSDVDETFTDVAELAAECRFRDCTHSGEPGCAVQAALAEGALPHDRFASYLELQKEIAYLRRRTDEREQRAERERWKKIHREIRNFSKEGRSRGGGD